VGNGDGGDGGGDGDGRDGRRLALEADGLSHSQTVVSIVSEQKIEDAGVTRH
jgi:hypothetical protein